MNERAGLPTLTLSTVLSSVLKISFLPCSQFVSFYNTEYVCVITLIKYNWLQYILELQICLVSMCPRGRSRRVWAEGSACCLPVSVPCTELAQSLGLEMLAERNVPHSPACPPRNSYCRSKLAPAFPILLPFSLHHESNMF